MKSCRSCGEELLPKKHVQCAMNMLHGHAKSAAESRTLSTRTFEKKFLLKGMCLLPLACDGLQAWLSYRDFGKVIF